MNTDRKIKYLNFCHKTRYALYKLGRIAGVGIWALGLLIFLFFLIFVPKRGNYTNLPEKYCNTHWVCSDYGMEFSADENGLCYGTLVYDVKTLEIRYLFPLNNSAEFYVDDPQGSGELHIFDGDCKIRKDEIRISAGSWTEEYTQRFGLPDNLPTEFVFTLE